MIRRLGIAVVTAVLVSGAAPIPAGADAPQASLPDIEDEVMCTICGTLLAESQSPQADRERALIRTLIAQGRDKDQIKDALVAEYGPRVLATPTGHGFDLLAWLVPGAAILIALLVGGFLLVRQRSRAAAPSREPELDQSDLSRLDRDMSSYDL